MKVVLFCGGLGLRLREYSDTVPKPMVPVGDRPIIWHVMKYYSHFGHRDFVLCLGHGGDLIKKYFLTYEECVSNDFVLSEGGGKRQLLTTDISDWRITFVDTGLNANLGQRLVAVHEHLRGEPVFLANYADGLTDLLLQEQIARFEASGKIASFLCVQPNLTYDFVALRPDGTVQSFRKAGASDLRINGGYFVFRQEIFDYIREGEELVQEPFRRLIDEGQLIAHCHDGFFLPMDTFKEKQRLDDLYLLGKAPWVMWRSDRGTEPQWQPGGTVC